MDKKSEWCYGNWRGLGWGAVELIVYDIKDKKGYEMEYLDFDPEWEQTRDVVAFWKNRSKILKLKNMTLWKYTKHLCRGIKFKVTGKLIR